MWELDHKEGWALKNWCFRTVVPEKTLESPLGCRIKPVNPTGCQPWIFIGKTDAEAPILWLPDVKSRLTGKGLDAGKDWRQSEKERQRIRLDRITDSMDMNLIRLQEIVKDRGACRAIVHGVTKGQTWLSDWTSTTNPFKSTEFYLFKDSFFTELKVFNTKNKDDLIVYYPEIGLA